MDDILGSIIDLINTSPNHQAWLDEHPSEITNADGDNVWLPTPGGKPTIHITGPIVDDWRPDEINIDKSGLHIGPHKFDLNDPKSIEQIETMFGCDTNKKPTFNPIDAIGNMIEEPPFE